jgi:hypothetical protein
MRINVGFDDDVYPELKDKLSTVRVKKRAALIVRLASERLCLDMCNNNSIIDLSSNIDDIFDDKDELKNEDISGYDLSGDMDSLIEGLGR